MMHKAPEKAGKMQKAVFLDRDGVVNKDNGYIYQPKDFFFMDGIFEFCLAAQKNGYLLFVITNQSGIARGYYTEKDFLSLSDWMTARFEEQGIRISKVYYCPFHPKKGLGKYKVDSYDRKPNPGMLLRAQEEFYLNLRESILVGDKDSDMEAGRRAGVGRLLLVPGKYECMKRAEDVSVVDTLERAKRYLR